MLKEVRCNLCGKSHYTVLYKPKGTTRTEESEYFWNMPKQIVKCLWCGLIYVTPRESYKELIASYRKLVEEEYGKEDEGRRIAAKAVLRRLKRFKRKGRILDVGCAVGFLLDEARKAGWESYGIELSRRCVTEAKERFGLDIYCGSLRESGFENSFFDVIILRNIIEHLPNPKEALIEIRRMLKPDGVLFVSTPNINSLISKILRTRWWGIDQAHLFYFTRETLQTMLEVTGFLPIKFKTHARTLSLEHWTEKFRTYNKAIYRILNFFVHRLSLGKTLFTINVADRIEVYARKSRRLKYVEELESIPSKKLKSRRMKTVVVLPAYNAAKTLKKTLDDIPKSLVDDIILVDDKSKDNTVGVAKKLGLKVFVHDKNKGYGANQKTCYKKALELGADIVVMVHPDYQYDPKAIPDLIAPIKRGEADAVFGSRMMKGGALIGGMPLWKHNANILLTAVENIIFGTYLTEYHSGFRAYSAKVLNTVRFMDNSDGFVFDTEIIAQVLLHYMRIEEVPIRTRYFDEASTIKLLPSIIYGFGILKTLLKFTLHTRTFIKFRQFE